MDISTALQIILDALGDSVAVLDEPLGIIREACLKESATDTDTEDWKGKYEDLLDKYKKRFVELVTDGNKETASDKKTVLPEVSSLTFDDIEMFDGSTE